MVAHVLSLNTGTAAVLDALTTPNGVTGMLALDTSDSNRPRLFEGTLGGRKLAWLDEVPPISTTMLVTASNATNPTALQNLTGSILSYSGSTLSLQSGKTLDLSAGASNNLGTPTTLVLTNATGLPVSTGISGLGTGVATFLATPSSANLAGAVTDETGSGALVFATSPTFVTPALDTPSSGTLTSCTGLPISTGVSGLGTGVATFLATPSSANLASAVTDETGSGSLVFGTSPTIASPAFSGTATGTYTLGGTPTLSGGTLSGTTTLGGNGQISSAGELGLGASPNGMISLNGTYTTVNSGPLLAIPTVASTSTGSQFGFSLQPIFTPMGASLNSIVNFSSVLNLGSTAFTISSLVGNRATIALNAGFSGSITTAFIYDATTPVISGGSIATLNQYNAATITNGNGATSGTVTNRQFRAQGITSGAAGATLNNRGFELVVPSGGASSGTANNRGLYITGNGGTASGGTVNNFAIYSDSTAASAMAGWLTLNSQTVPTAVLHLQGAASAAAWTTNGLGLRAFLTNTITDTSSSGTVAETTTHAIGGATLAASSATTYTQAETLRVTVPTAGSNVTITNAYSIVTTGAVKVGAALEVNSATLIKSNTTLTNGAGALTGTLTNSPATGNPTKWIPIDDNGTTRYIPAW